MSDEPESFYKLLHDVRLDPSVVYHKKFIFQYYQIVPKYYMLSTDINTLVLNYSVGSGKTSAGCFCALNNINTYKMFMFNKKLISSDKIRAGNLPFGKNVTIVGNWVTVSAVCNELLRPEFHFISKEEYKNMTDKLNSVLNETRMEGETIRNNIIRDISKYINFHGYQSLFNNCFPSMSMNKYTQNAISLIIAYEKGNIDVDKQYMETLRNGIVIIDEMQKLYSAEGINTYGFAIMCIVKLSKEYNIKIVFLTGTMFNTTLAELPDIINITSTLHKIYRREDCLQQIILFDDVKSYTPTDEFKQECLTLLHDNFIYYNQSRASSTTEYIGKLQSFDRDKNVKCLVYPERTNLPTEIHIGDSLITDTNDNPKMILYSCEVEGLQKDEYKKYLSSHANSNTLDDDADDSNENRILIQDSAMPSEMEMLKRGITYSDGVYYGKFMKLSTLKQYSTIGWNMCNICIDNTFRNEKTIVYHNKLKNFGLYQYMMILDFNGFVQYGNSPTSNSICKACRQNYDLHSRTLDERIKHKVCNHFAPMVYYKLTGSMTLKERDFITNNVYNNPNNIYGDRISVMFVSDVAYSGVSFLNTNNLLMLSRVSNMSKWKQIYARVIRTKSHALLPKEKRFANIYTMILRYPDENKEFNTSITNGEKYYKIRTILDNDIDDYMNVLSSETIGNTIINKPEQMTTDEKTRTVLNNLYENDIINEIDSIIDDIMDSDVASIWNMNTLVKRIKDNSVSCSFANLSKIGDNNITSMLLSKSKLSAFNYDNNGRNIQYVQNKNYGMNLAAEQISSFSFNDLSLINVNESVFLKMVDKMSKKTKRSEKLESLNKILVFVGKKYDKIVNNQKIMDALYEIHDEYYEDDEFNFFKNHTEENRNITKMAGFYYGEIIVLNTGKVKQINYSYPDYNGWSDLKFKFKISCLNLSSSSLFYLHVTIAEKQNDVQDLRKVSKGIVCTSVNVNNIKHLIPGMDIGFSNKREWCDKLLAYVIERQYKDMNDRNAYTPFEK